MTNGAPTFSQIGCDMRVWPSQLERIKEIPEQVKDGTLSEVTQLPVFQWGMRRVVSEYARSRRDTAGSGDDLLPDEDDAEYDEEEDYDDDDYDSNEGITEPPQEPKQKAVLHNGPSIARAEIIDEHPHRHHHGEDNIAGIGAGLDVSHLLFFMPRSASVARFTALTVYG